MRYTGHPPLWIALAALLLATTACSMQIGAGSHDEDGVTTVPIDPPALPPPTYVFASPTPRQIIVIVPPPTFTPVPTAASIVCSAPPVTWVPYSVQSGNTLSSLARATGTTTALLAQYNCLPDADYIRVGQIIYLPPTPTPLQPVFASALAVDDAWLSRGGGLVTNHPTVRVVAGTVHHVLHVEFWAAGPVGTQFIAADYLGQDGFAVSYTFPAAGEYTFWAVAVNGSARQQSTLLTLRYDPAFVPGQAARLAVAPYVYLQDGWYTVAAGQPVSLQSSELPLNADHVDFWLTPYGSGSPRQFMGSDPYPGDGVALWWWPPSGIMGYVQAVAYLPDRSTVSSEPVGIKSP